MHKVNGSKFLVSDEAHHSVLEATSIVANTASVGEMVESCWKKIEALENQEWANFVLNFQKKKKRCNQSARTQQELQAAAVPK